MDGDLCAICWQPHHWTDHHVILATVEGGDEWALIGALAELGVGWTTDHDPEDPMERSYGLMRMIDDAAAIGLDCSEVDDRWVVTCVRGLRRDVAA